MGYPPSKCACYFVAATTGIFGALNVAMPYKTAEGFGLNKEFEPMVYNLLFIMGLFQCFVGSFLFAAAHEPCGIADEKLRKGFLMGVLLINVGILVALKLHPYTSEMPVFPLEGPYPVLIVQIVVILWGRFAQEKIGGGSKSPIKGMKTSPMKKKR